MEIASPTYYEAIPKGKRERPQSKDSANPLRPKGKSIKGHRVSRISRVSVRGIISVGDRNRQTQKAN